MPDGATLQLQEGEKIGVICRNGNGKSPLLRLIAVPKVGYRLEETAS